MSHYRENRPHTRRHTNQMWCAIFGLVDGDPRRKERDFHPILASITHRRRRYLALLIIVRDHTNLYSHRFLFVSYCDGSKKTHCPHVEASRLWRVDIRSAALLAMREMRTHFFLLIIICIWMLSAETLIMFYADSAHFIRVCHIHDNEGILLYSILS